MATWSLHATVSLLPLWEQLEVAADARGAGAALITAPVDTVPVDDAAQRVILWETSEGIDSFTAFPRIIFRAGGPNDQLRNDSTSVRGGRGAAARGDRPHSVGATPERRRLAVAHRERIIRSDGDHPGWVAFATDHAASDITLVRSGEPAHRAFGSDNDGI